MANRGIFNEYDIIETLDKTRVFRLTRNWKYLLEIMFGTLSSFRRIRAGKMDKYIKPDIYIEYKGVRKYISIKSGRSKTVHTEKLETLCAFLKSIGISDKTIKIIKLFHYGDGTMNGTGKERYSFNEVYVKMEKYIKYANRELNSNPEITIKFLERVLFQGVDPKAESVDYIFFGYSDLGGEILSREKIEAYIRHKKPSNWDFIKGLHIGPIAIRPHARYAHEDIVNEESRHKVNCGWDELYSDLLYINKKYGY